VTESDEIQNSELKSQKSDIRAATAKIARRSALYLGEKPKAHNSERAKQRERQQILKLFLVLQATGIVAGAVVASVARLDLLAGVGLGLGLGSVNFGVSLTLSSRD
jgi:hypothetical protein